MHDAVGGDGGWTGVLGRVAKVAQSGASQPVATAHLLTGAARTTSSAAS
ncbi:hypothetical protein ABZ793_23055 [Micromonospora sp. NPDC047465]